MPKVEKQEAVTESLKRRKRCFEIFSLTFFQCFLSTIYLRVIFGSFLQVTCMSFVLFLKWSDSCKQQYLSFYLQMRKGVDFFSNVKICNYFMFVWYVLDKCIVASFDSKFFMNIAGNCASCCCCHLQLFLFSVTVSCSFVAAEAAADATEQAKKLLKLGVRKCYQFVDRFFLLYVLGRQHWRAGCINNIRLKLTYHVKKAVIIVPISFLNPSS